MKFGDFFQGICTLLGGLFTLIAVFAALYPNQARKFINDKLHKYYRIRLRWVNERREYLESPRGDVVQRLRIREEYKKWEEKVNRTRIFTKNV